MPRADARTTYKLKRTQTYSSDRNLSGDCRLSIECCRYNRLVTNNGCLHGRYNVVFIHFPAATSKIIHFSSVVVFYSAHASSCQPRTWVKALPMAYSTNGQLTMNDDSLFYMYSTALPLTTEPPSPPLLIPSSRQPAARQSWWLR